jgi:23S rRNA (pseudouridine1915-N3)-methyltransferase
MAQWYLRDISDSDKHFVEAILEYKKRLGSHLILRTFKPTKHWSIDQIRKHDTQNIVRALQWLNDGAKYTVICLSLRWASWDTMDWLACADSSHHIVVVVWWPYGLDEQLIKNSCNYSVSFGSHTMPHWLAKVVLLEQIYRVTMLQQGRKYHY